MRLTFLGAAGEVTGSQHLVETSDGRRILLDCGLFQGPRAPSRAKNERFHCQPSQLDAVILSHAHIDHCGNLPRLVAQGFDGPIFCTPATADIAELMLIDSARIQAEDARYLRKHLGPNHPPIEPLYTEDDVRQLARQIEPIPYGDWHQVGSDVTLRFDDAGHILGSAITQLDLDDEGHWRRLVFTGDLGRRDMPLLHDPQPVERCDVLISECLYGNRRHPPASDMKESLREIAEETCALEGRLIIPAFSLGRTQQVIYFLNELHNEGRLPPLPFFVDSPLATRVTRLFRHHEGVLDEDVQGTLHADPDAFSFPGLVYTQSQSESVELNHRQGPFAVISASGMCENGRVVHHLRHAVEDERNAIVLLGYQAPNTLGRQLADQLPEVRIFDRHLPRRARVLTIEGLSAHADVEDFRWWFGDLAAHGGAGQVFLVHGEPEAAQALAGLIADASDEPVHIPKLYASFEA